MYRLPLIILLLCLYSCNKSSVSENNKISYIFLNINRTVSYTLFYDFEKHILIINDVNFKSLPTPPSPPQSDLNSNKADKNEEILYSEIFKLSSEDNDKLLGIVGQFNESDYSNFIDYEVKDGFSAIGLVYENSRVHRFECINDYSEGHQKLIKLLHELLKKHKSKNLFILA